MYLEKKYFKFYFFLFVKVKLDVFFYYNDVIYLFFIGFCAIICSICI